MNPIFWERSGKSSILLPKEANPIFGHLGGRGSREAFVVGQSKHGSEERSQFCSAEQKAASRHLVYRVGWEYRVLTRVAHQIM